MIRRWRRRHPVHPRPDDDGSVHGPWIEDWLAAQRATLAGEAPLLDPETADQRWHRVMGPPLTGLLPPPLPTTSSNDDT